MDFDMKMTPHWVDILILIFTIIMTCIQARESLATRLPRK